jgi:hypothetical protein
LSDAALPYGKATPDRLIFVLRIAACYIRFSQAIETKGRWSFGDGQAGVTPSLRQRIGIEGAGDDPEE